MRTAHRTASRAKRYQANPTSWATAIAANQDQQPEHATMIMNKIRVAFELLKTGTTDSAYFDRLASAFNVGLIRAASIDPLVEHSMRAGIEALQNCDAIWQRHKRYGFHGPDLEPVADAIDVYEEILRNSTPRMMEEAVNTAARRMLQQARVSA